MRAPSLAPHVRLLLGEARAFARLVRAALGDLALTVDPEPGADARQDAAPPRRPVSARTEAEIRRLFPPAEAERRLAAEETRNIVRRNLEAVDTRPGNTAAAVRVQAVRVSTTNLREFRKVFGFDKEGSVSHIEIRAVQPGLAPMLDKFQQSHADLVTRMNQQTKDQIRETVDEAWSRGTRVEELRDAIAERFEVSESRAALIARDQVLKLNGAITKQRQTSAGVREYIWTTAGDERVRGSPLAPKSRRDHYHLDGTTQSWDAPPMVADDGTTAHPGEDYQCRCIAFPVLEGAGGGDDSETD